MKNRWGASDYGKSGYTPTKQEHLRNIAAKVMCAARVAGEKNSAWVHERFLCVDLFAGPGVDDDGDQGSPLVLMDAAYEHLHDAECWFFEQDWERSRRLRAALETYHDSTRLRVRVGMADCAEGFPFQLEHLSHECTLRTVYGLIYADPTSMVPWPLLAYAAERLPRTDILISLPATTQKRVHGAFPDKHLSLEDGKALVAKEHWLIRELWGRHQWTLLLGTNYEGLLRGLKRIGMYDLKSREGQRIWDRATHGRNEQPPDGPQALRLF